MEGVALDHFNKFKPSTIPMELFNSHLSDESDQGTRTNATYLRIILQFFINEGYIAS